MTNHGRAKGKVQSANSAVDVPRTVILVLALHSTFLFYVSYCSISPFAFLTFCTLPYIHARILDHSRQREEVRSFSFASRPIHTFMFRTRPQQRIPHAPACAISNFVCVWHSQRCVGASPDITG